MPLISHPHILHLIKISNSESWIYNSEAKGFAFKIITKYINSDESDSCKWINSGVLSIFQRPWSTAYTSMYTWRYSNVKSSAKVTISPSSLNAFARLSNYFGIKCYTTKREKISRAFKSNHLNRRTCTCTCTSYYMHIHVFAMPHLYITWDHSGWWNRYVWVIHGKIRASQKHLSNMRKSACNKGILYWRKWSFLSDQGIDCE